MVHWVWMWGAYVPQGLPLEGAQDQVPLHHTFPVLPKAVGGKVVPQEAAQAVDIEETDGVREAHQRVHAALLWGGVEEGGGIWRRKGGGIWRRRGCWDEGKSAGMERW